MEARRWVLIDGVHVHVLFAAVLFGLCASTDPAHSGSACGRLPAGRCFANPRALKLRTHVDEANASAACCAACADLGSCRSWTTHFGCADGRCSCNLFSTVAGEKSAGHGDSCISGCLTDPCPKPAPVPAPAPAPGRPPAGAKNDTRPSVLLVHVDSMDGRMMAPGSPAALPNLQKLAARGVAFTLTYTAAPECVPSRSSVWSGRRNDQTMAANNGKGLDCDYPILANRMNDAGYEISVQARHDFNWYGDGFTPRNVSNWMEGAGPHPHRVSVDEPQHTNEKLRAHSYTANVSAWLRAVPDLQLPVEDRPSAHVADDRDPRRHSADWKWADGCSSWLHRWANFTTEWRVTRPFLLSCGFITPHPPFSTNQYYLDRVDESKLTMPTWESYSDMHPVCAYDSDAKNVTYWSTRHPHPSGLDSLSMGFWTQNGGEQIKAIRRVYAAMCVEADALVGSVVDALETAGLAGNTLTVFWSDHGELAMDHVSWYKMSVYEGASRVPLVIAGAGVRTGGIVNRPTSLLDIFPTVLSVANVPEPQAEGFALAGHSLEPDLRFHHAGVHQASTHPNYVLVQWHGDSTNTGQFALIEQFTDGSILKYIHYAPLVPHGTTYAPRLFNLSSDGAELDDMLGTNHSKGAAAIASKMADTMQVALDGRDPDAVDRDFKAQDKAEFRKYSYVAPGQPGRARFEETLATARWELAWDLDKQKYLRLVDVWMQED